MYICAQHVDSNIYHIYVYIYLYIHTYTHILLYIHIHMYICIHIFARSMWTRIHIIYIYIYTYIHTNIYIYIHIYIHMYVCIHIFARSAWTPSRPTAFCTTVSRYYKRSYKMETLSRSAVPQKRPSISDLALRCVNVLLKACYFPPLFKNASRSACWVEGA